MMKASPRCEDSKAVASFKAGQQGTRFADPTPRVQDSIFSRSMGDTKRGITLFVNKNFGAATQMFAEGPDRSTWTEHRNQVSNIVESPIANAIMCCIITFNTVMVIMETDSMAKDEDLPTWLSVIQIVMLVIYIIELAMRFYVQRKLFWSDGWNLFDLTVVCADVLSEIVNRIGSSFIPSLSFLRVFRVGRLLRFFSVLRMFKDLNKMIKIFIASLQTLVWGIFLIIVMITGWSIVAVMILHPLNVELEKQGKYEDCPRCPRAFESVFQSNLTFFQQLIFGDEWGGVNVTIIENYPFAAIIIIMAGVTVQVGLLNLILVVIVEKATEQRELDIHTHLREQAKRYEEAKPELLNMCIEMDQNQDGTLCLRELEEGFLFNKNFAVMLNKLELTGDDLKTVFNLMDDDSSGRVSHDEFVEQMHRMQTQGIRPMLLFIKAKGNDIRKQIDEHLVIMQEDLEKHLRFVETQLSRASHRAHRHSRTEMAGMIAETQPNDPSAYIATNVMQNIEEQLSQGLQQILKQNGISNQLLKFAPSSSGSSEPRIVVTPAELGPGSGSSESRSKEDDKSQRKMQPQISPRPGLVAAAARSDGASPRAPRVKKATDDDMPTSTASAPLGKVFNRPPPVLRGAKTVDDLLSPPGTPGKKNYKMKFKRAAAVAETADYIARSPRYKRGANVPVVTFSPAVSSSGIESVPLIVTRADSLKTPT